MNSPLFLFVHGWAGTPRLWDDVCACMQARGVAAADLVRVDLNDEWSAPLALATANRPVIGIGHSLGGPVLLQQGPALAGFVGLNSFTRFTSAPDFAAGTAPRVLTQMRRRLRADPAGTLADFLARAGLPALLAHLDVEHLAQGLDLLATIDARQIFARLTIPHITLGGTDDLIVPPAHARACFAAPVLVDGAGHGLPVTHAALCVDHILSLAERC